jgi:putative ABC transport system permease protein
LNAVDPGFDPDRLLTFQVALPWTYPAAEQRRFHAEALRLLEEHPAITSAALNGNPPLTDVGQPDRALIVVEGQDATAATNNPYVNVQGITPAYFETMGMRIVAGRGFLESDRDSTHLVAIVSERLAARLWPEGGAVGRRLRRDGANQPWLEVIGIANDVRYQSLDGGGGFDLYISALQVVPQWSYFMVRTRTPPGALIEDVRAIFATLDANQPVYDFVPMRERMFETVSRQRVAALLFTGFGAIALLLAAAGVAGIVAHAVRSQSREIGVRMALGASGLRVAGEVVVQALLPVVAGIVVGLAGGVLVARSLRSLLHGVTPFDPVTFGATAALMVALATLSAVIPALGAARLSPLSVMQER